LFSQKELFLTLNSFDDTLAIDEEDASVLGTVDKFSLQKLKATDELLLFDQRFGTEEGH